MTPRNLIHRVLAALAAACLAAPAVATAAEDTTAPLPPLRGLYYSAEELAEARRVLPNEEWRTGMRDYMTSAADAWLARSDEWIRDILPEPGSLFSYGQHGCPECGASWRPFGANTCSLDNPGKVVCPQCKTVFPSADPASPYYDTGRGVMIRGKRHYFTAVWNAYVVSTMYSALGPDGTATSVLAIAHALTGNPEYARKAIVIMDALATLSPTTRGPRDFDYNDDQTVDKGRFHLLTSIVYRAQIPMARNIDLVGNHPMMCEKSPTNPDRTVFENIRHGLYDDYLFKEFDVRGARMSTLHNHEADSIRAMIAAGLLFGNADYIRWGMQCFDALLENTVDRDGMYYETSLGYAIFTRGVFLDMAELLANYRPEKYAGKPGDFPPARNYFDHPKLQKLIVDNFDLDLAGHRISLGNSHGSNSVIDKPRAVNGVTQQMELARMARYTTDENLRARLRKLMAAGADTKPPRAPVAPWWWLFKETAPMPEKDGVAGDFNFIGDGRFFSTKGMAAFQFGDWPNKRGFVVRGGPNLPHAHDDNLGLNLFDLGRELCAELGYGTFDTPLHKGWSTRAISHSLVTVDGDAATESYFKKTPGASWRGYLNGEMVKYMDADGSAQFPADVLAVEKYRRRIAAVVVDEANTYYVDLFDVRGSSFRDYAFHAPYHDELLTNALTLEGVRPDPVKGAWTLAGLSPEFRNASWNAPGRSWGERVGPAESIRPVDPPDQMGGYGWTPPGRGYGFLFNLRGGTTSKPWSATWAIPGNDKAALRLNVFPTGDMGAYAANAPDRSGAKLYNFVIARDEGSSESRFLTVIEPYRATRAISSIDVLRGGKTGPVALRVRLADGRSDVVVLGEDARETVTFDGGSAAAEFAFLRVDKAGHPVHATMMRGTSLKAGGTELLKGAPAIEGAVKSVNLADGSFTMTAPGLAQSGNGAAPVPGPDGLAVASSHIAGGTARTLAPLVVVSGDGYPVSTTMELKSTADRKGMSLTGSGELRVAADGVALQQFRVDELDADARVTTSTIPLPLSFVHSKSTRALDGRHIADTEGRLVGRVESSPYILSLRTTPGTRLAKGSLYWVMDFVAGDKAELPIVATWTKDGTAADDETAGP